MLSWKGAEGLANSKPEGAGFEARYKMLCDNWHEDRAQPDGNQPRSDDAFFQKLELVRQAGARKFKGAAALRSARATYAVVEFVFSSLVFGVTRPYATFTSWHWNLTATLMVGFLAIGLLAGAVARSAAVHLFACATPGRSAPLSSITALTRSGVCRRPDAGDRVPAARRTTRKASIEITFGWWRPRFVLRCCLWPPWFPLCRSWTAQSFPLAAAEMMTSSAVGNQAERLGLL